MSRGILIFLTGFKKEGDSQFNEYVIFYFYFMNINWLLENYRTGSYDLLFPN